MDKAFNIIQQFEKNIHQWNDKTAIVSPKSTGTIQSVSYRELHQYINSFGTSLLETGIRPRDRLLVMVPMSIELYISILATIKIGAICVFVDPHMPRKEFDSCCQSVKPKAFIGIAKAQLFRLLCQNVRKIPHHICIDKPFFIPGYNFANLLKCSGSLEHHHCQSDDTALISFTTGSSGAPKGSERTHGFLLGQMEALKYPFKKLEMTSNFPGFPILTLEDLLYGRTITLPEFKPGKIAEVNPSVIVDQIHSSQTQMMSGSPAYLEKIADYALAHNTLLYNVKLLYTGGAPISAKALKKVSLAFPKADVHVVYGSTEAEPVSSISAEEVLTQTYPLSSRGKGNCVGYPIEQIEVAILPLDFQSYEIKECLRTHFLKNGMIGEITVRGAHVNTQYWNNTIAIQENKIKDPNGTWHRMGDAGYMDEKGRLWVVGRTHNAMFTEHDSNPVFPYQIEAILDDRPEIHKSACFMDQSKTIRVAIQQSSSATLQAKPFYEALLKQHHPHLRKINIAVINHIPVDARHNSKVLYKDLKKQLEN